MKYSMILIAGFVSASLAGPTTNASRQNVVTWNELCKPFNGNENACTDALRDCLPKKGGDPERTQTCVHAAAKRGVDDDKQQKDQQTQKPRLGEYCTLEPNNCADGLVCESLLFLDGKNIGKCVWDRTQKDQQPHKPGLGEYCTLEPNNCANGLVCESLLFLDGKNIGKCVWDRTPKVQQLHKPGLGEYCTLEPNNCANGLVCESLLFLDGKNIGKCVWNRTQKDQQLSLDGSSPPLTFKYATSQPSSDNWIGIWPEDNTQAPTWGSTTWDYAKESLGSLQLTPPSSMKAGKYKAYLLSGDRTVLALLRSFEYSPISDSVAFSVKTHYKTNCAGSVDNNVDIRLGNGVCINTDCAVGSLEIPSVGSCPDGEIRISYWQNADCKGDWYGYGYGSRGTCRGLWSNGWGFKSLWVSCAKQSDDCVSRGECSIDEVPSRPVCS
ncbi:hypothetical protein BBAD15_g11448 [Beauveria bassiana D1-5]|uniref:Uncharacterized protein n=1 Tax=Beauveria bassiana D1-5 TaxID=1245745 RepID=A0A0A2V668_BEABA|nr:hypothetical protein BBAD15_g11448 [Beauveria bassiana D1-5]